MSNYYKPVIYLGIKVEKEEMLKQMNMKDYDEFFEWKEHNKLDLNGHHSLINEFGVIYTDDDYICMGLIISASGEDEDNPNHVNLIQKFEDSKLFVSEKLRLLKITTGDIGLWHTTLCY